MKKYVSVAFSHKNLPKIRDCRTDDSSDEPSIVRTGWPRSSLFASIFLAFSFSPYAPLSVNPDEKILSLSLCFTSILFFLSRFRFAVHQRKVTADQFTYCSLSTIMWVTKPWLNDYTISSKLWQLNRGQFAPHTLIAFVHLVLPLAPSSHKRKRDLTRFFGFQLLRRGRRWPTTRVSKFKYVLPHASLDYQLVVRRFWSHR